MAAAICEISNCHCTQLNYCLFTNHSPLVSWQQYLTTIANFSLNSTVIHSPTTPLWYHGSNTQPPIANFSLNLTVIHSPTTPLWYHGSNTQPPLPISHSTQLSSIHQPLHIMAAILNHLLPVFHSTQLLLIHQPLPSGNMAAILHHHC